ncbi:hypothetical protein M9458_053809, partial [Cirrhinus mrigala]
MSQAKLLLLFPSQVKPQATADLPESAQVTADLPESSQCKAALLTEPLHDMAASIDPRQATAIMPEPCQLTPPEPRHVSADLPKPCQVSSHFPSHAVLTLSNLTASTPSSPAGIPLSSVLPVMAVAILSVWSTHCTPESSSDHKSAPEASSDHKSVLGASPVHKFVPVPPEVSAYAVEPPKEGASIHELTVSSVHESTPEISSDHESAPVPPEVAAPAAEPPKASSYELSAHHVTAKEAYHELSALLWMSFVPLVPLSATAPRPGSSRVPVSTTVPRPRSSSASLSVTAPRSRPTSSARTWSSVPPPVLPLLPHSPGLLLLERQESGAQNRGGDSVTPRQQREPLPMD